MPSLSYINMLKMLATESLEIDSQLQYGSRVLIAEAWNATPHLETGLELCLQLAAKGYHVSYIHYGRYLRHVEHYRQASSQFLNALLGQNITPEERGEQILRRLSHKLSLNIDIIHRPKQKRARFLIDSRFLSSLLELKTLSLNGTNSLGLSVASSLVSLTGNSQVLPLNYEELCNKLASAYIDSYEIVRSILARNKFSAVIVFNGRFASVKGAVVAAKEAEAKVFYHERGCSKNHFSLRSYQPHNRIALQQDILRTWSRTPENEEVARSLYINKRKGVEKAWSSFVSHHRQGLSAAVVNDAKSKASSGKVIVYFSGSDDEYSSVDDAFSRDLCEWSSQKDALIALSNAAAKHGHALVVRVHPHQQKKDHADRQSWDNLDFIYNQSSITIVDSSSPVSTYELIDAADIVVTYGSTVGIESVYWGKPSVLLGNSFYDQTGASIYCPKNAKDLEALIADINHLTCDPSSSLPYAFYLSSFGNRFVAYNATTLFSGTFLGVDLSRPYLTKRSRGYRLIHGTVSLLKKKLFSILG